MTNNLSGKFGAAWGFGGVFLLIASAVWRLTPIAQEIFANDLTVVQWVVLITFSLFMAFGEGYRGFQKAFAPRVAARALYLRQNPRPIHIVFAPLFCLAFFHTTPERQRISIGITTGIIVLVVATRMTPQPWRGIIDFGVVLGLVWGLMALSIFGYRALARTGFSYPPEVPNQPAG